MSIASLNHDSDDRKAVDSLINCRLTACTRCSHSGMCLPIATSSNLECLCVLLVCRLGILFPSRITITTAKHSRDKAEYMKSIRSIRATYNSSTRVRMKYADRHKKTEQMSLDHQAAYRARQYFALANDTSSGLPCCRVGHHLKDVSEITCRNGVL